VLSVAPVGGLAAGEDQLVYVGAMRGRRSVDMVDLALVAGYVATGACTPTVLGMNVPVVHPRKDARSAGSKLCGESPITAIQSASFWRLNIVSRIFSYFETETHCGTVCFGDTRASRNHAAATTVSTALSERPW
jgi:hypothetical protein